MLVTPCAAARFSPHPDHRRTRRKTDAVYPSPASLSPPALPLRSSPPSSPPCAASAPHAAADRARRHGRCRACSRYFEHAVRFCKVRPPRAPGGGRACARRGVYDGCYNVYDRSYNVVGDTLALGSKAHCLDLILDPSRSRITSASTMGARWMQPAGRQGRSGQGRNFV